MRSTSAPTATTSPWRSWRPRRVSTSLLTVTAPSSIRARASPPDSARPDSFSAWPRRMLSPRMGRSRTRGRVAGSARGALVHLAAPGAALGAARLDELLEALEVALDAALEHARGVSDLLDNALGLGLELQHDLRARVVDAVEGHHAGLLGALRRGPRDPLVGVLLGDLRVELLLTATDLRAPMKAGVIELTDLLDALHEARELLELGPLVVGGAHGHGHFDALLDR